MVAEIDACTSPLDSLTAALIDILSQISGFRNPLGGRFQITGGLSIDILGCIDLAIATPGFIDDVTNGGGLSTLDSFRNAIVGFIPPKAPDGFPSTFNQYFPAGMPADFEPAFMAGFPDGLPDYLPYSFRAEFEKPFLRVKDSELTSGVREAIFRTGMKPDANGTWPAALLSGTQSLSSLEDLNANEPLRRMIVASGINPGPNLGPFAVFDPKAVCPPFPPDFALPLPGAERDVQTNSWFDVFNEMQSLIPNGGFRSFVPAGTQVFPPVGFTGFSADYKAQLASPFRQFVNATDYMSNVLRPIRGVPNQPEDFAFDNLSSRALSYIGLAESIRPSSSLEMLQYTAGRFFSAINTSQVGGPLDALNENLALAKALTCIGVTDFLNNILFGPIAQIIGLLGGIVAELLSVLADILNLDLLGELLSQLLGTSLGSINFSLPRPNLCAALNGVFSDIVDPQFAAVFESTGILADGTAGITDALGFAESIGRLL